MNRNILIGSKVWYLKISTLITFLVYGFCVQDLFGTDISVWPNEIKFDYDRSSYTYDALTIRENASNRVTVPEWKKDVRSNKIAYIKGYSNRKIQVSFDSNCQTMHLIINLTVTGGIGIGTVCNFFVANYTKLDFITLTLDGTLLQYVGEKDFIWRWEVYAIPIGTSYCAATSINSTSHSYYVLYSNPINPMTEPWVEVLDYACDWASGQYTNSGVLSTLCHGLYHSSGLDYNGGQTHYEYISWPSQKFEFNLTRFLYEWDEADCQDMSMFLSILSSSLGASLNQTRRIQGSFTTKSICPVGPTYGWITVTWNFHHVGWLNNIYDSSIRLNSSSPYIAVNANIDNPYKADLYNSGTWSPQNAFILGQTDPYWDVPTDIK